MLHPGSHVKVFCTFMGFGFWHHGIVSVSSPDVEAVQVIHFALPEGSKGNKLGGTEGRSIVETSLDWFLEGGKDPRIEDGEPDFDHDEIVRRARGLLGKSGYSLPCRNCEHFASWCRSKSPMSKQMDNAGNTALIAAAVFVAFGVVCKVFALVPFAKE